MIRTTCASAKRRRVRPHLEPLEDRCVLHGLALTPLVEVSGPSPFLDCPIVTNDPGFGTSTEVEPYLAVNPTNSNHLVGVWIQDFARGIVGAVSFDGGTSWQSIVIPGVTQCEGGIYPHAADPWVSFAPNGDVYVCLIGFDFPPSGNPNALLVSKSTDGGLTWGAPTTVVTGDKAFQEKAAITADPTNPQLAYVAWSLFDNRRGTAMFSRTTDGGQTWEPARVIFDPGTHNVSEVPQIIVLPDGTLVDIFVLQTSKNSTGGIRHYDFELALLRSSDHGQTWTNAPIPVAEILALNDTATVPGARGVPNPDGGLGVIAPHWFFDVTVDPASGNLYAVWQDVRFSNGQYVSIAFSMSTDGGLTWSAPIRVNQTPDNIPVANRQAFLPSVAVNQDGVVAITYYDFRNNTPAAGLPTDYWMVHAHPSDGLTNPASWSSENRLTAASFNIENATSNPGAYFIGDYQGLVAQGSNFGAFFAMPTETDSGNIFYRDSLPAESHEGLTEHDDPPDFFGTALELGPDDAVRFAANALAQVWFIDAVPARDSEVSIPRDPGEQRGVNRPTVLEHELSHGLGFEQEEGEAAAEPLTVSRVEGADPLSFAANLPFDWLAGDVDPAWTDSISGRGQPKC